MINKINQPLFGSATTPLNTPAELTAITTIALSILLAYNQKQSNAIKVCAAFGIIASCVMIASSLSYKSSISAPNAPNQGQINLGQLKDLTEKLIAARKHQETRRKEAEAIIKNVRSHRCELSKIQGNVNNICLKLNDENLKDQLNEIQLQILKFGDHLNQDNSTS